MKLKFWGTRGSIPVPGESTIKYGGNTPCIEVRDDKGELLILDGGSGIRELGNFLIQQSYPVKMDILITHYHWDHIQGIPFFLPLYIPSNEITFYGITSNGTNIKNILHNQMLPNNFPIRLDEFPANVKFHELKKNEKYFFGEISVETFMLNHPSPTLSFKIMSGGDTVVYMTDNELMINNELEQQNGSEISLLNKDLIEFCKNCDYLIHDSMYEEKSISTKKGWGHSSNESLALFSMIAEVKNLVLFHYNPDSSDSKIDSIVNETKIFLQKKNSKINCFGAREGQEIIV